VYEVIGTVRSPGKVERERPLGAQPVAFDLLDGSAVHVDSWLRWEVQRRGSSRG
jgi:hypothetical protein